jgi:acetyl/propionyl-CoA carboxylase alpha subunit
LFEASIALTKSVNYAGAGTIEYLLDEDGRFYFLEMNTRIQVEHTVTEEVTGVDLVREQLSVAAGNPLSFTQETISPRGHSIQVRLNAEDPGKDFAPGAGRISKLRFPDGFGVRVDAAVERRDVLVEVNNRRFLVNLPGDLGGGVAVAMNNGVAKNVRKGLSRGKQARHADHAELVSPIQGVVVRVVVANGQRVTKGELVCVVEAMKMENEIAAHRDGVISGLAIAAGETVKIGAHIVSIDS